VKRWIFIIVLFLLLGAIVNVAVAWACALWAGVDDTLPFEGIRAIPPLEWAGYVPVEWPAVPDWGFIEHGRGIDFQCFDISVAGDDTMRAEDLYRVVTFDVGLPLRSLRWELHGLMPEALGTLDYFPDQSEVHDVLVTGLDVAGMPRTQDKLRFWRRFPLLPRWPGFIVNTLFYGALLWLLIPGPFVLRRVIRIKRGLCPKCGYDLRRAAPEAGIGCPECGWNRASETKASSETV
jgi:hypothetical protein